MRRTFLAATVMLTSTGLLADLARGQTSRAGGAEHQAVVTQTYDVKDMVRVIEGYGEPINRAQVVDAMLKLIEETIAPEAWHNGGGTIGEIDAQDDAAWLISIAQDVPRSGRGTPYFSCGGENSRNFSIQVH